MLKLTPFHRWAFTYPASRQLPDDHDSFLTSRPNLRVTLLASFKDIQAERLNRLPDEFPGCPVCEVELPGDTFMLKIFK